MEDELFDVLEGPRAHGLSGWVYSFERMSLVDSAHVKHAFARTAMRARRDGVDRILCSVNLDQGFVAEFSGPQMWAPPGRPLLFDMGQQAVKVEEPGRALTIGLDREVVAEAGLDPAALHGTGFGPLGPLFLEHMRALCAHLHETMGVAALGLTQATVGLLAACIDPRGARGEVLERARPQLRSTLLSRAQRFIRAHVARPELSPDAVALAMGVSRTTLYRAFEPVGGVSETIRLARLAAARQALSDPTDSRRVSEIAYGFGFRSEAQFSRAFRTYYGETPRDVRREALVQRAG